MRQAEQQTMVLLFFCSFVILSTIIHRIINIKTKLITNIGLYIHACEKDTFVFLLEEKSPKFYHALSNYKYIRLIILLSIQQKHRLHGLQNLWRNDKLNLISGRFHDKLSMVRLRIV